MCNMFRFINQFFLFSLLCFSIVGWAEEDTPTLFEADYTIQIKGAKVAKMTRRFSRLDNGEFQYHSETRTTGLISIFRKDHIIEISKWKLDLDNVIPIAYYYEHSGGKKDRTVNISFDWEKNHIINSIDGSSWKMPAAPNILDKLLYQLAIMYDLQAGKESLQYAVADGGRTKIYNFEIIGEEIIETPLGMLKTVKLERHKPNSRRKSTLWCAKDLEYLPIKVENIEKDGKITVALISSLQGIAY
ncbi:MAG: hypothetical protein ACI9SC_003082 [Gammaproteobacteria bacterium]